MSLLHSGGRLDTRSSSKRKSRRPKGIWDNNEEYEANKKDSFDVNKRNNKTRLNFAKICTVGFVLVLILLFIISYINNHSINIVYSSMSIKNESQKEQHSCNILVAHGPDPFAAYATLIYLYPINFLIMAERRGMKLWIDFKNDYNHLCYDASMGHENVWNYYLLPIDPQSQQCDVNSSQFVVLSKKEIFPQLHYGPDWAVRAWYYHWRHQQKKDIEYNAFYKDWYFAQRSAGHRIVGKYYKYKGEIIENVESEWNHMFKSESAESKYEILGVHMRGTDKAAARRKVFANEYIKYMKQFIAYFGKERARIFVATDDKNYLFEVEESIDTNLLFTQQNVVRSKTNTAVFRMQNVSKYQIGKNVLSDILLLSKCHWFVHSASAVAEAVFYHNLELHNKSVHLEYTKNRQIPIWFKDNL